MGKNIKLSFPAILLLGASLMQGQTIKEVVEHTISNNPKIMSTAKNNEAYRLYIDEAEGGYLPKLDLTAYVGVKNTKTNPDAGNNTSNTDRGYNAQLDFEQLIYDGGLTSGQIDEAQFRYSSNKYLNDSIVDDIIYDSLDSYLNLVKYKNRVAVANESLSVYNEYFQTAKETAEISGIALHESQVNAKIHYANNKLYQDTNNLLRATSSFKKNVGMEDDGKSCRPNLDVSAIPSTLKDYIDQVLLSSPKILEQVENIKEQRAILNQSDASFFPTLKFKAQGIYDKSLITTDEQTNVYSARIELTYNLLNGGSDKAQSAREKAFLAEAQTTLDTVTSEVIDEATAAYNAYMYAKKREEELSKYITDNQEILGYYKDQFEGGTRTFIDVLNIERDLISAKEELIDIQYDLDAAYFNIFKNLGTIKESVLSSNNDTCTETKVPAKVEPVKEEVASEEVQALLAEDTVKPVQTEEMIIGTYAVYFVAHKDITDTQKAIDKMQEAIGPDYKIKVEPARGLQSGVIYNLKDMKTAKEVRAMARKLYADSYIIKVK